MKAALSRVRPDFFRRVAAASILLGLPLAARAADPDFTEFRGKFSGDVTVSAPALTTEKLTGEAVVKVKTPRDGGKADVIANGSVQSLLNPGETAVFSLKSKFKRNGKAKATITIAGVPIVAPGKYRMTGSTVKFSGEANFQGVPMTLSGKMTVNGDTLTVSMKLSFTFDASQPPLVVEVTTVGKRP